MKNNTEDPHQNNPTTFNPNSQTWKDIPKIRVIVRKRPCSKKEIQKHDIDIIENRSDNTVIVKELKNKLDLTKYIEEHHYKFDMAYNESATNEKVKALI